MYYIVQDKIFRNENYNILFDALDRLGMEYSTIDMDSINNSIESTERKDVFVFGSVRLAKYSVDNNWIPGSFYGGNHDYLIYKEYYKDNLLNYDSIVQKISDPIDWAPNEIKFIRPCQDNKAFNGGRYTSSKWIDQLTLNNIRTDMPIQISSIKKIYKEARVWVVGGKVVTSSYYLFNGDMPFEENVEPAGIEFAQSMVDIYQVAEAFVIDICLTPDGWKIVEVNCINCSGFYNGDLQKLIISLEDHFNPLETKN